MKSTQHKDCFKHSNRFIIGLIICVLMLAPLGNVFADTVICVDDASTPMSMMNDSAMDTDMDCCADLDLCETSCDLSMFSVSVLLDSTSLITIGNQDSRFSNWPMDFIPFLPPPPLIRPPVSV